MGSCIFNSSFFIYPYSISIASGVQTLAISNSIYKFYLSEVSSTGGWLYLYSFICLSAGVVERQSYCFVIILLHHAPPRVASVLVLFVIFGGLLLVLIYR